MKQFHFQQVRCLTVYDSWFSELQVSKLSVQQLFSIFVVGKGKERKMERE